MLTRILLYCGILSSLLYVGLCIVVPMQYPGYSSFTQTISELSAIGAPTRVIWTIPGIAYTLLIAAFGFGMIRSSGPNRPLHISGILMTAYGIIGLAWSVAPMHQREVLAAGGGSVSDTMHLVMAAISSLFMMIAMGFGAAAFNRTFRWYTVASILTLLFFGTLTSLDAPKVQLNQPTPWLGVWERIMIGVFLVWVIVVVRILLGKKKK